MLLNRDVSRGWDWGSGRGQPEAVGALQHVLALDPEFRLLVAHGYTDLVTPYFGSALILRQLEVSDADSRVRQENYRGGHMFYMRGELAPGLPRAMPSRSIPARRGRPSGGPRLHS